MKCIMWLWCSFDVGGVHMVVLTPYAGYERDSKQYRWLQRDLADFDREVTPWLVVSFHAPWYNTLVAHYQVRPLAELRLCIPCFCVICGWKEVKSESKGTKYVAAGNR